MLGFQVLASSSGRRYEARLGAGLRLYPPIGAAEIFSKIPRHCHCENSQTCWQDQ